MSAHSDPPEIALCAAWHGGSPPARLQTVDGVAVETIHRGAWSHGLGPDFQDALFLFGDRELRAGSVEVHVRTRGWTEHGHHLDPAYNSVVLHLVSRHDGSETRRQDGALVPVVEIGAIDVASLPAFVAWDWDRVGGRSCAEHVAAMRAVELRAALLRLGDARMATRSARLEARLVAEPPAQILWSELLDGLGYAANRDPMREVAAAVNIATFEDLLAATAPVRRLALARGILLGVAGFLPLSPSEAELGQVDRSEVLAMEEAWQAHGVPWREAVLSPVAWQRARVRPANHPISRLLAAASIVTNAIEEGGLLAAILSGWRTEGDAVDHLRSLSQTASVTQLGQDRALEISASIIAPFALALAEHTSDGELAEAVMGHWDRLATPAGNAITRRALRQVAGAARLGKIGARGAQGLIQLDTAFCQPRRCFECPIAVIALSEPE